MPASFEFNVREKQLALKREGPKYIEVNGMND
jgi:hypothetical protein